MMAIFKLRYSVFLFGCIGARLLYTFFSYMAEGTTLQILGFLALYPVVYWSYLLFVSEKGSNLSMISDIMWWKNLRPIHLILWALFAYLALSNHPLAYVVLLVDTAFGATAFFLHHHSEGNLNAMIQ